MALPTAPVWRAALLAAALAGCRSAPPPAPEVRVHATVGERAASALLAAVEARGLARPRRVAAAAEAEVLWLGDPTEVIALGPVVAEGEAPATEGVAERFLDPRRRFAPVGARALVLVRSRRVALPFEPVHYRDLADPRLAGRQALPAPGRGATLTAFAALALVHGERGLERYLELLARTRAAVVPGEAEARALAASGEAAVALTSSEEAAAGAASAAGLEVVFPDQDGKGAVILPTCAALTRSGTASAAAREVVRYLSSPEAERLLVARAPGYLPLREGVPVPVGVRSADRLRALPIDWDRLAAERSRLAERLAGWP